MTAETVVPLRTAPRIDHPRAERAVAELLAALGYPVEGEHRAMTPQRVANAFAEMLTPSTFLPTTFGNDEGYDELVVARVVEHFAAGLQVQERLTQQVADWLAGHLGARGVGVVLEAEHLCMTLRGVRARGSRTVTSALRGELRTDARSRGEFLALTRHAQC